MASRITSVAAAVLCRHLILAAIAVALLLPRAAEARSLEAAQDEALHRHGYDCRQMRNAFDFVVCSDPILLEVMGELFASYRALRTITPRGSRDRLWRLQERWIDALSDYCDLAGGNAVSAAVLDSVRLCVGHGMAARVEALTVATNLGGMAYLSPEIGGPGEAEQANAGRIRCLAPNGAVVMLERATCDAIDGAVARMDSSRDSAARSSRSKDAFGGRGDSGASSVGNEPDDDGLTWQDVQDGVDAAETGIQAYQIMKFLFCRRCR